MAVETIKVPDLGGADGVEIIEIPVAAGDEVAAEDTLLVLESDKASMDLPSPAAGVINKLLVKVGDTVSEGDAILELEREGADDGGQGAQEQSGPEPEAVDETGKQSAPEEGEESARPAEPESEAGSTETDRQTPGESSAGTAAQSREETIALPDLGTDDEVEVIEVSVGAGDEIDEGDALMTLEGDKATMDVPSTRGGRIVKMLVEEGSRVKSGQDVVVIETTSVSSKADETGESGQPAAKASADTEPEAASGAPPEEPGTPRPAQEPAGAEAAPAGEEGAALGEPEAPADEVYAGPMVRQFARELGVDLRNVEGSGMKGRIQKEDVQAYVRAVLRKAPAAAGGSEGGAIPPIPDQDFSRFGEVEDVELGKIAKLTATNMHRAWLNVPAVTQFDDADITDLEAFRQSLKGEAEKRGVKVTLVAFLMQACARALRNHPVVNRSWHSSGEKAIQKHYVHIGMAVDTPRGLMVPVIRDVDQKGLFDLAKDIAEMADKARDGKLAAGDMQGGCFSISSLGAIGGRGFTPIVNAPEAAILGVSKASVQPVWNGEEFVPRQLLPLSLTYDHKLVNGADAGRFLTELVESLGDMRRLLL